MRYLLIFLAVNAVNVYAASNRLDLDKFTGIQEIKMNAAFSTSYDNIAFGNVRILSDQTDLDDYVQLFYEMNSETVNLDFQNATVYKDIGVISYDASIFIKDVPSDIIFKKNGNQYRSNVWHYDLQSDEKTPFTTYLEAGTSLTFVLTYQSDDYQIILENADTQTLISRSYGESYSGVIYYHRMIFESGLYNFYIKPSNNATMKFDFFFNNENRNKLTELHNNQTFSASFIEDTADYAKWRIYLKENQKIKITPSDDDNLECYFLFEDSTMKGRFYSGIPGIFVARETGNYYLICRMGTDSGYVSGKITITDPDPSTGVNHWQIHENTSNFITSNSNGFRCIQFKDTNIIPHDELVNIQNRSKPLDELYRRK